MSYLNVPRIHFFGQFLASPSTVNNRAANFNPAVPVPEFPPDVPASPSGLTGWNPMGVARFLLNGQNIGGHPLSGCTVQSVMPETGSLVTSSDPIIGAMVQSQSSGVPGKIVDLDPGQQFLSQLFGLQIQLVIAGESNAGFSMKDGSFLAPPNLTDLFGARFSGIFETVITPDQLEWHNTGVSEQLGKFQYECGEGISLKFTLDRYNGFNGDTSAPNFNMGRITGALGPAKASEPARCSVGRKFIPATIGTGEGSRTRYQSGYLLVDQTRQKAVIDISNSTTQVDSNGNPFPSDLFAAVSVNGTPTYLENKKNIVADAATDYQLTAGIVELDLTASQLSDLQANPLALYTTDPSNPNEPVLQEADTYVNLSRYFMRVSPSTAGTADGNTIQLIARQFGNPLQETYDLNFLPGGGETGIHIPATVTTNAAGRADIQVTWDNLQSSDLQGIRSDIGSELYFIGGAWQSTSNMFWSAGQAGLSVIAWPAFDAPSNPTWDEDVFPVMRKYMRLYPGMKRRLNLADYDTAKLNAARLKTVFTLPESHPHAMPVTRDLSPAIKAMVVTWIDNGTPQGSGSSPLSA